MTVSLIVAMSKNRVIGVGNDLPWHLPADLKYFKATTLGKPIIMGRKTFDSIGRPLPGRLNIVVTRNHEWVREGVQTAFNIEEAVALAGDVDEVMITGGAQIYAQSLTRAERMYITEVDLTLDGDAYFPEYDVHAWQEVSREKHTSEQGRPAFDFVIYERR